MLLIYFVLTHLLMNCKRSEKLRLYCNEETRCIGWIDRLAIWMVDRSTCDLDGGSIDLRFGWWIDRLAIWMVDRSTCGWDGGSIDLRFGRWVDRLSIWNVDRTTFVFSVGPISLLISFSFSLCWYIFFSSVM